MSEILSFFEFPIHVENTLKTLHREVHQTLSSGSKCTNNNCSRKFGSDFDKWCSTCNAWWIELEKHKRNTRQRSIWKNIDSIDWPQSYEEVGKVYLKDVYPTRYGIFKDLGSVLSLFRNCDKFSVETQILDDVHKTRNDYFAHNYQLRVHAPDKIRCIEYLIKILQLPEIAITKSAKSVLPKLSELLTATDVAKQIIKLGNKDAAKLRVQIDITYSDDPEKAEEIKILLSRINSLGRTKEQESKVAVFRMISLLKIILCLISGIIRISLHLILLTCFLYGYISMDHEEISSRSECVDIREINSPFQTTHEIYLNIVSKQSDTFVEREWLHELIEEGLFTSRRGVYLVGEPGHGKTSMISKLLLANASSIWFKLKDTVIFFHICRFDRSITQKPFVFIQNMARALLNEFPVMCNMWHTDEIVFKYFDENVCSRDTVSCFDHLIIQPLKCYQEHFASRRYTIVIDALDECQLADEKYDIVDLLFMNLHEFPMQFAFILTSRNTEEIVSNFRGNMFLVQFADYKQQIDKDIVSYISTRNVPLNWNVEEYGLVKQFNGNFLYAKHFLDYCSKEPSCMPKDIPMSLRDTFKLNLIRIFGKNGDKFNTIRPVFEVLSAASKPLTEEMLIEISGIDNSTTNVLNILGKELRHFVQISQENGISFVHKALSDYLTDYSLRYSIFFIDRYKGHKRFADYLFKVLNTSRNVEVIELAHHVALSKNKEYEDFFLLFPLSHSNNISKVSFIHQTAIAYNCYDTMALILKFVGLIHIDNRNPDNKTASYLAAEYGHNDTLKALLDFGADINFQMSCNTSNLTEFYTLKCEYSLLEIAAYNGHHEIVRLLLSVEPKLLHHRNAIGINALHVASIIGRILVLKEILRTNISVSDSYALYVSAINGFYDGVELLLANGFLDVCLPCNGTFYWKNNSKAMQIVNDYPSMVTYDYLKYLVLRDYDLRLRHCETALHAAVKMGHLNIVQLLLNQSVNSLQCRNSAGLTPVLSAIENNQTQIFIHLYENGANITDRVSTPTTKNISKNVHYIYENSNAIICYRNSTSMMHLLAMYNNIQITKYLLSRGINNWLQYDDIQASTLHYAFCHGSTAFISIIEKNVNFSSALLDKTIYGHTPYHFAINCGNPLDSPIILGGKKQVIQDDFDIDGRSLLQLAIMHTHRLNFSASFKHLELAISAGHNLSHVDKYGNNFLHHAGFYGNRIILGALDLLPQDLSRKLFTQYNHFNISPIHASLIHFPYVNPDNVNTEMNNIVSEIFIWNSTVSIGLTNELNCFRYCLEYQKMENITLTLRDIEFSITHLLQKFQVLPLIFLRLYYNQEFEKIVSEIDFDTYREYFTYYPAMQLFFPKNVTEYCINSSNGLLHKLAMNYRNQYWRHFENYTIWDKYMKPYSAKIFDECFDKEGHNLLHKSVLGGHHEFVTFLLKFGMNVFKVSKTKETVFDLSIRKFHFLIYKEIKNGNVLQHSILQPYGFYAYIPKRTYNGIYMTEESSPIKTDFQTTLTELLDEVKSITLVSKMQKVIPRRKMCTHDQKKLGLIHIAAAKGYLDFLKYAEKLYSETILNCTTLHNITPKFLASVFDQRHVVQWLSNLNTSDKRPSLTVKRQLAAIYINNFSKKPIVHWSCSLQFQHLKLAIVRRQMNKCAREIMNNSGMCIICSIKQLQKNYRNFKSTLNIVLGGLQSAYVDKKNIGKVLTTRMIFHLYKLFHNVLDFGLGDRRMVYTMLSYDLHMRTGSLYGISDSSYTTAAEDLNDITLQVDEYPHWVREKMQYLMEQKISCASLEEHERKIKLCNIRKSKTLFLKSSVIHYCESNATCLSKKCMYEYFNQTMICTHSKINSLFELQNLYLRPYVRVKITITANENETELTDITVV